MIKKNISDATKNAIKNNIDVLFESLKQRLLGGFYSSKINLRNVGHDKVLSLPGLYTSAYLDAAPNHRPTYSMVEALASVAESYIDSSAERTKANALSAINNSIRNLSNKDNIDFEKEISASLLNVFDKAHGEVKKVIETELQRAKTIGLQDGILDAMQGQGIDDPTVAFATKKDAFTCSFCKDFFLQEDGITPRVYKLSELGTGYLNKKSPIPVLPPVHPNCFLYGDGRVYTTNGFKRIKNISFGDKVLTHTLQWKPVINTLNFLKMPYNKNFYEIKTNLHGKSICITPDHKVYTNHGMKRVSEIDHMHDKLIRLIKKCSVCSSKMIFSNPAYFCSSNCRDLAFGNLSKYIEKIGEKPNFDLEEFDFKNFFIHHDKTEPTFLYDITIQTDHSLNYNGLITHNCRCLMIGVYRGFGFDSSGNLEYKSDNYDEYLEQKKIGKSKTLNLDFFNHDCNENRKKELLDHFT